MINPVLQYLLDYQTPPKKPVMLCRSQSGSHKQQDYSVVIENTSFWRKNNTELWCHLSNFKWKARENHFSIVENCQMHVIARDWLVLRQLNCLQQYLTQYTFEKFDLAIKIFSETKIWFRCKRIIRFYSVWRWILNRDLWQPVTFFLTLSSQYCMAFLLSPNFSFYIILVSSERVIFVFNLD